MKNKKAKKGDAGDGPDVEKGAWLATCPFVDGDSGKIFQPLNGLCHKCKGKHVKWQCAEWLDAQAAFGDEQGRGKILEANVMMQKHGGQLRVEKESA